MQKGNLTDNGTVLLPPMGMIIICNAGYDICLIIIKIGIGLFCKTDCIAAITVWHKLHEPHGTCIGTFHGQWLKMSFSGEKKKFLEFTPKKRCTRGITE